MDNLLLPLLYAQHEQERQRRLDELITIHVAPIIRKVLQERGFYVSAQGVNESSQDAEDLYQEAMMRVVQVLREDQRSLATIENLGGYVRRVVENICFDFRRSQSPIHTRLKNSLRELFRRHKNLASWRDKNEILCGFAAWRNTRKVSGAHDSESKLDAFLSARFANEDVKIVPLSRLVAQLFDWIGGPVEMDALVRTVAYVLEIKEQPIESLDDHVAAKFDVHSSSNLRSAALHLETIEVLGRLWRAVKELPPRERDVFAFRFEDQDGQDLFTVLLAAGVVNWNDLASGMGRSVTEVIRLRRRMPMDTETVARELNTARSNVSKWKYRAFRKMRNELK